MSDKKVTRELAIFINDREVTNSLRGVSREISKVNSEMRNLNKNSATYDEDLKKLQKDLAVLKDRQSEFKDEIAATSEVSLEASESISKIFLGLSSGNLNLAKEGLEGVRGSISGMVTSARAFIATPIGAAIAVLSGFAIAAKYVFDFNAEAEKSARLIENLSGKTGQAVEDIRIKMQALANTFGLQFEQLAGAVDNLVDTGVAKNELEALEKIKQGLLTAPDKSEFITSLETSAVTAKQVGIDLEEVIALKKQIEETGVNPEATFGALQKASRSLALQTDELRTKLTNAFGAAFTDEVLAKVKTGEITTVQALDMIGKKSKEVGLNQTQQAELGQQLFGKAAQTAGGYATILETVTEAQKKNNQELTENQKAIQLVAEANERLEKAQSDLMRIENFGSIWDKIKAASTDALSSMIEWVVDLRNDIQPLIDVVGVAFVIAWENIKATTSAVFSFIGGLFKAASNTIGTFVNFFKKLFEGDFRGALDAIKQGFINFGNIVKNTFGGIYNAIIGGVQGIVKAIKPVLEAVGVDVDKLQKKLEGFKVKIVTNKSTTTDTKEAEAANTKATQEELAKQQQIRDAAREKEAEARRKAEEARKAEAEKAQREEEARVKALNEKWAALSDAKAQLAKAELNAFLANNKTLLENNKFITDELLQAEINRLNAVNKAKQEDLLNESNRQREKATATAKSQEELDALLSAIDLDYQTKKKELDAQTTDAILAARLQKEAQDKQIRIEQENADKEIKLANAQNEWDEKQIRLQQQSAAELLLLEERENKGFITKVQFATLSKQLAERTAEEEIKIARAERDAKLTAYGEFFGNIAQLLGENTAMGKAAAIAQIGISQGLAIARVWEEPSILPQPLATINRIVQSGIAVANVMQALKKVNSVKVPSASSFTMISKSGFFYGGDTGSTPALGYDQFGAVTGVVHEDEWVAPKWMKQSPRYARTINWLENERKRVMRNGFATGGNVSSSGSSSTTPSSATSDNMDEMLMVLRDLKIVLQSGIFAKVFFGYEDAQAISDLLEEKNQSQSNGTLNN